MTNAGNDTFTQVASLRSGVRVWVGGHDRRARKFVERSLASVETVRPPEGPLDAAFITPQQADEAAYFLHKVTPRLNPSGVVVFVWSRADDPAATAFFDELTERLALLGWRTTSPVRRIGGYDCVRAERGADDGERV